MDSNFALLPFISYQIFFPRHERSEIGHLKANWAGIVNFVALVVVKYAAMALKVGVHFPFGPKFRLEKFVE